MTKKRRLRELRAARRRNRWQAAACRVLDNTGRPMAPDCIVWRGEAAS